MNCLKRLVRYDTETEFFLPFQSEPNSLSDNVLVWIRMKKKKMYYPSWKRFLIRETGKVSFLILQISLPELPVVRSQVIFLFDLDSWRACHDLSLTAVAAAALCMKLYWAWDTAQVWYFLMHPYCLLKWSPVQCHWRYKKKTALM